MSRKSEQGFTLVELMIVLVIIAVLASIAVPSYQNSVTKSRRADAKNALSAAVLAQEKWFFQNSSYTADVDNIGGDGSDTLLSPDGYYQVTLNMNSGVGSCVGSATVKYNCFTLTATPLATGPQADDADCTSFSITHLGNRTATGANSGQCW